MSKEKQTDAAGWKDRLNDLDDLPGGAFIDKNAAWDTLQNKLQDKPRRKKIIWYLAAACLLPLLWWVAVTVNKKETAIVQTNAPVENKAGNDLKLTHGDTTTAIAPAPSLAAEKNTAIIHANQFIPPSVVQKKMAAKDDAVTINHLSAVVETSPGILIKDIDIPDTAVSFASLPVAKKKLRVVHVNEIETPPAQFAGAPGRAKSDIRIIIFGSSYSTNPNNTATDYTGGIKISLTN